MYLCSSVGLRHTNEMIQNRNVTVNISMFLQGMLGRLTVTFLWSVLNIN